MIDDPLYQANLRKIEELRPECQAPASQWMAECFDAGFPFRISEAFRSQKRQEELYKIGRRGVKGELPVTWTHNSKHTQRVALDIYPTQKMTSTNQRIFYVHLQEYGTKFGIERPQATLALGDYGHWELEAAHLPPKPNTDPKKEAEKQIRLLSGNPKQRAIDRFVKIFGVAPNLD